MKRNAPSQPGTYEGVSLTQLGLVNYSRELLQNSCSYFSYSLCVAVVLS